MVCSVRVAVEASLSSWCCHLFPPQVILDEGKEYDALCVEEQVVHEAGDEIIKEVVKDIAKQVIQTQVTDFIRYHLLRAKKHKPHPLVVLVDDLVAEAIADIIRPIAEASG